MTDTPQPTVTPSPTPTPAVVLGAGDIAICGVEDDEATAALIRRQLEQYPNAAVIIPGDTVQGEGRAVEYRNCFDPSWGQFKDSIYPAPGNHDYLTDNGMHYYEYFGERAGEPGKGYYSFDLGAWHIVALNSNCGAIACGSESVQVQWLREDLAASDKQCTLLYWHHPRWGSGLEGSVGLTSSFFRAAYEYGAEVVVSGNDHDYERFAAQNGDATPEPDTGVRQFVVGTGGAMLRAWGTVQPNSEVRDNETHGVMQFKLYDGWYEWEFLPAAGGSFTDSGSDVCH
jgi:3',5'-cyclic AMP phosphodiesterase CpdA